MVMHWPDGRQWTVDRVLDVRMAPSMVGGGHGMRYVCRIANKQVCCSVMMVSGLLNGQYTLNRNNRACYNETKIAATKVAIFLYRPIWKVILSLGLVNVPVTL